MNLLRRISRFFVVTVASCVLLLSIGTPITAHLVKNLRVIGTSRLSGEQTVILEDASKRLQDIFAVGDSVFGFGTLTEINDKTATIKTASGSYNIFQTGTAEAEPRSEQAVKKPLNEVRMIRHRTGSNYSGFTLPEEALQSAHCRYGLRNGDTITTVNGVALSQLADANSTEGMTLNDLFSISFSKNGELNAGPNTDWQTLEVFREQSQKVEQFNVRLRDGLVQYSWNYLPPPETASEQIL